MTVVAAFDVAVLFAGGCSSAHGTSLSGDPSESATGVSESPTTDPYPTDLYPTPEHSFDIDDVLRSPTP
ncbi:hypothetical protein ACFYXF_19620 [Streptomyces sp. NPDC002680]|uniref:hypothetical protein n=1 Tax=Streptomyces sp. NPDC002680 TaxID=3364659 RepID=UPI0036BE0F91